MEACEYCVHTDKDWRRQEPCISCEADIGNFNKFETPIDLLQRLKQENAQLKEALRKCSCGIIACRFCDNPIRIGHTDDCEYIKLTKESEGEG